MSELVAAEERVRTLVAAARRRNEGFKAVCEKLGVDAEEADGLITELVPDPSDDAIVMHALLVGVLAGRAGVLSALLSDEVVEAVAKDRWERHWTDPQGMADWEYAKQKGMPGPAGMLRETRADLQVVIEQVGGGRGE